MKSEIVKNGGVVILFAGLLYALFFINLFTPASQLSYSERRKLAQFPRLTAEAVWSAEFMEGFDSYAVDQMAFREEFRSIKAVFDLNILRKSDHNGIFMIGDMIFKTEYPLDEKSVVYLCDRINYIHDRYLHDGMEIRFSIVPDKNYYMDGTGRLVMDYREMEDLVRGHIRAPMGYIDLFGALTLEDYYRTDAHWKQENLENAVAAIRGSFGLNPGSDSYMRQSFAPFYGVYYGQSALNVAPDEIVYLTDAVTENAVVSSMERPGEQLPVYDLTALGSMDSYSLFMAGPAAIVTAQNPLNDSGRELILFRDSYASSLSPLLLEDYSTVTLIDLRYIHPDYIGEHVRFSDQDVLFLYSSTLFNQSASIR